MIALLLIGLVVLIIGKLRLTRSIRLAGKRARWYGLTLFVTAIPFALLIGALVRSITPEAVLINPLWGRVINYGIAITYLVLLALPFRERNNVSNESKSSNDA
jgi:hypothetical protein